MENDISITQEQADGSLKKVTLPAAAAAFLLASNAEAQAALLAADLEPSLGHPETSGLVLTSTTGGVRSWIAQTGGGGAVSSVAGRTGDVTLSSGDITDAGTAFATSAQGALADNIASGAVNAGYADAAAQANFAGAVWNTAGSGNYNFQDLVAMSQAIADRALAAVTLAGYGITDGATLTELSYKADKATTLAGYGITDASTAAQGSKADSALQPTNQFDGTNFLTGSHGAAFGTSDFSLSMWFRPTALAADVSGQQILFTETGGGLAFSVWDGHIHLAQASTADLTTFSTASVANNTWVHLAISRTGSDVIFFVNGTILGDASDGASSWGGDGSFTLGANTGGGYNFVGNAEMPTFWNRALGSLEVASIYNDRQYEISGTATAVVSAHAGKVDGSAHSIYGISGLATALEGKASITTMTATAAAVNNPTLSSGEFLRESDTSMFKIGNGASAYDTLMYPPAYAYASLTGSLGSLDTFSTVHVVPNAVAFVDISGTVGLWVLKAGTADTVAGLTQRPLDYDASTNAKYWQAISLGAPAPSAPVSHPIQTTPSTVYTVDAAATGVGNGQSWYDAFTTVEAAIAAAKLSVGKSIWIKAGTYYPDSNNGWNVGNARCKNFHIANNIPIYGGFAGWEGSLSDRTNIGGNPTYWSNVRDNNYHILRHVDTTYLNKDSCVIDGITFIGGANTQADGTGQEAQGAGILLGSSHGITLNNCSFQGLKSVDTGAAIMINTGVQLVLNNCTFTGNSGVTGGAIGASSGLITATSCVFTGNSATGATSSCGGAAINAGSSYAAQGVVALNCTFVNNLCPTSSEVDAIGGGACRIKCDPGIASFTGCYFSGNTGYYAGGMFLQTGGSAPNVAASTILVSKCSFISNVARYGILFLSATNGIIDRCTLQGNYSGQSGCIYLRYNTPHVYNTLISGNKADLYASGIYINAVTAGVITNCTVAGNFGVYGTGLGLIGGSVVDVYNSIVWGNFATTWGNCFSVEASAVLNTHSCCYSNGTVSGSPDIKLQTGGVHNNSAGDVLADPLFENYIAPSGIVNPNTLGVYTLRTGSPCLNVGLNANVYGSYDLTNLTRIVGSTVDMGCYEKQS